jgi:hypothetical protein
VKLFVLDAAGTTLPEGLRFFTVGWWVIHLLAVVLVFSFGYRKGRRDERRERERTPEPPPQSTTR